MVDLLLLLTLDNLEEYKILFKSNSGFCIFIKVNKIVFFTGSVITLMSNLINGKIPVDAKYYPIHTSYSSVQRNDGINGELCIGTTGEVIVTQYSADRSFSGFYFIN